MGITGSSVPKRTAIEDVNRVTAWVLWAPFVVSLILLLLSILIRLVIHFSHNNDISLRRWTNFRNRLAKLLSGAEFIDVYSCEPIQQGILHNITRRHPSISSNGMISINLEADQVGIDERMPNQEREKDLYLIERRIPAKAKGAWLNLYLVLLPLQVAFITIIIVHNIYAEQYSTESCNSLTTINNNNESIYYECRNHEQSQSFDQILKECDIDNVTQSISCTAYYYNPLLSHTIIIILNSLVLHLTLARIIIRFILAMRYAVHKSGKICRKICPSKISIAFFICLGFLIIVGIVATVYLLYVDHRMESNVTTDMVFFAFVIIGISIVFFLCGLWQKELYESFSKCSYNVTDDSKPENDDSDQTSQNCFCCSFSKSNTRKNYEEIQ